MVDSFLAFEFTVSSAFAGPVCIPTNSERLFVFPQYLLSVVFIVFILILAIVTGVNCFDLYFSSCKYDDHVL